MDLTTKTRDAASSEISCKLRTAKSVFSIRSLVDLGENGQKAEDTGNELEVNGKKLIVDSVTSD